MNERRDDIENFFKNHLSKGDFEFDENQWQALENRLDTINPIGTTKTKTISKSIVKWGAVSLITLITFVHYLGILPKNEGDESTKVDMKVSKGQLAIAEKKLNGSDSLGKDQLENRNNTTNSDNQPSSSSKKKMDYNSIEFQANISNVSERSASNKVVAIQRRNVTSLKSNEAKSQIIQSSNNPKSKTIHVLIARGMKPELAEIDMTLRNLSKEENTDSIKGVPKEPEFSRKLILGAFVAPDFNSTSFAQLYHSFGESLGLDISYLPSKKIRLTIGATLTNKRFKARNGEFNPEQGFWTNGISPESTDASSLVLSVPLSIGYNLTTESRSNLYLNLKTTTYWMLSENYDFQYAINDSELRQGWSGQRENFHLFGSYGISILYQKPVSAKFYLEVEPYLNSPLSGIGEGAVNLYSSGINVGISFWPGRNPKSPPDG